MWEVITRISLNFVSRMRPPPSAPPVPVVRAGDLDALGIAPDRPLAIVDVDEVLGQFMAGFGDFLCGRGLELRVERFALIQNIYRPGETECLTVEEGRGHIQDFFRYATADMAPVPGAAAALRDLSRRATVVICSNAPPFARMARARWLGRHGFDYPLALNNGPKGPMAAAMAARSGARTAFVDDLISNLDSVAEHAPATVRFQHVADEQLRPLAPAKPDLHPRIDDWKQLGEAIEQQILR